MSGTRSHSPKAPATEVILVSHGQPSDPEPAERALAALGARVAGLLDGWRVRTATLAAPGRLDDELHQAGFQPTILPIFMTEGWFTRQHLPSRIGDVPARVLPPIGSMSALTNLAASTVIEETRRLGWRLRDTELLLAAHGSARGPLPARCTRRFAKALSRLLPDMRLHVGYLEQAPELHVIGAQTGPQSICLPFFAAHGEHVADDVPVALREANFAGTVLPALGVMDGVPQCLANILQSADPCEAAA